MQGKLWLLAVASGMIAATVGWNQYKQPQRPRVPVPSVDPKPVPAFNVDFPPSPPKSQGYRILNTFIRTEVGFTEGLSFHNGRLLESTGNMGETRVQYLNLDFTDLVVTPTANKFEFPSEYFGEGHAAVEIDGQTKVIMLTYTQRIAAQLDESLTKLEKTIQMPREMSEGWGMTVLTSEPHTLLASDGSCFVHELDVSNGLKVKKSHHIKDDWGMDLHQINELEFAKDMLFANVYLTDSIVAIDLKEDKVVAKLDMTALSQLANEANRQMFGRDLRFDQCLNGIAYHKERDSFFVTGKHWPLVFELAITV